MCEVKMLPKQLSEEMGESHEKEQSKRFVNGSEGKWTDVPFVGRSIYFLNKSYSKWICVGLSPSYNFQTVVKIVGIKKQSILFHDEEWRLFLLETQQLKKYVKDNTVIPLMRFSGVKINTECFDGSMNVLRIEKDGDVLYLSYDGMRELWHLQHLIEARLEYLESLNFLKYFSSIAEYVSKREEGAEVEIDMLLSGQVSDRVCILKELMMFCPDVLLSVIDLIKNIRA